MGVPVGLAARWRLKSRFSHRPVFSRWAWLAQGAEEAGLGREHAVVQFARAPRRLPLPLRAYLSDRCCCGDCRILVSRVLSLSLPHLAANAPADGSREAVSLEDTRLMTNSVPLQLFVSGVQDGPKHRFGGTSAV